MQLCAVVSGPSFHWDLIWRVTEQAVKDEPAFFPLFFQIMLWREKTCGMKRNDHEGRAMT